MWKSIGITTKIQKILKKIATATDKVTGNDLQKVYKSVFSGQGGDIVLRDLCRRFHINSSTFSKDSEMILREGERNAVLYILAMVYSPLEEE